jgi:hypothetical protein
MLRVLINGILTTANTLLNNSQNLTTNPPSTSKWRIFRNFIYSTFTIIGIPLVRSITGTDTVFEYVNTYLANSTTTRNNIDHRQQRHNSNLSRFSRPNFRRRSYHNGGIVRIIKPTINIHIH